MFSGAQREATIFSDGVASVTHVELNNSVITEVARANSSVGMVPKDGATAAHDPDKDQSESENEDDVADGGGKKKGGKKSGKGGKKDKKGGKKGDKKDKKEKKDKKGKKKGGGKRSGGGAMLIRSETLSYCAVDAT